MFQYFGKFVVKKYVFLTYVIVQSEKINAQKHVKEKIFFIVCRYIFFLKWICFNVSFFQNT